MNRLSHFVSVVFFLLAGSCHSTSLGGVGGHPGSNDGSQGGASSDAGGNAMRADGQAGAGGTSGQNVAHVCQPDPSCSSWCTRGACCGNQCCNAGEWCDTSGPAGPGCRCGSQQACNGAWVCLPGGLPTLDGGTGSAFCGAGCCLPGFNCAPLDAATDVASSD